MWVCGSGSRGDNVTPVVAGGDTDQAPCNLGWYECYVRLSVCTADGLAKLGGVAALPHGCLSISRDDMTVNTELCCAELSCLQCDAAQDSHSALY